MISNPTNIVATPKTVGVVATNVLEYENEESLEAEMETMSKVSQGENLDIDTGDKVQNYYNQESGVLRLTGTWANRHNLNGATVDSKMMKNLIAGMSPDGKQKPRYKVSKDKTSKDKTSKDKTAEVKKIMIYDFVMDMTYSSNKYINTAFVLSDFKTKEKIKEIHNSGNKTLTKLLDDFWLVEVNNKFVKPISRIEAEVDHYKSRSDELLLHKHRLTSKGCEVILEDGSVGYRQLDEEFIKNGSNRLMMDIICKNSELNECIQNGIEVSLIDSELSSVTGDKDMSFYKINAFDDLPDLFGTEQKIIHETYNESLSKWQTELVTLLTLPTRTVEETIRIYELESKVDRKNKTFELGVIAKNVRSAKSSSDLDDICKKQLDKVLAKYPNYKQKDIQHKNPNEQKKSFKLGEDLKKNEIEALLDIVFDKSTSVDQLRITAMIAQKHKGRFNYEQLNKQFENIQQNYLKSSGMTKGLNLYISKQHIFSQLHFKNQFEQINKQVVKPLMTSVEAKKIIQGFNDDLTKANRPLLNEAQTVAIERGLTNNRKAFLVSAPPGSGKTLAVAKPIIDTLRASNTKGKVYGAVVSNNASNILQNEIQADQGLNITKLVNGLRDGKIQLTKHDIVCIDETSMLALKDSTQIMEKIVNSGSRIVFIGDIRQLHSVGAGNAMEIIVNTLNQDSKSQLDKVVRQQNKNQAKVVEMIGDISDKKGSEKKQFISYTFNKLLMNKQVDFKSGKNQALAKLMTDYLASVKSSNLKDNKIYAYTVDDVIKLNNTAIDMLIKQGLVSPTHIKSQYIKKADDLGMQKSYDIQIHEKSRIMFKDTFQFQNKAGEKDKVVNGQAGNVLSVIGNSVTIEMDDKKIVTVNTSKFKALMPALAQSLHSSQGDTVAKTFTYIDDSYTRKLLLIGVSRGKIDNKVYVNGNKKTLRNVLGKDGNNQNVLKDIDDKEIALYEKEYNLAFGKYGNDLEKISSAIDFKKVKEKLKDLEIENEDVITIDKNNNKGETNGKLPRRTEEIRSNTIDTRTITDNGNRESNKPTQPSLQPSFNYSSKNNDGNSSKRKNKYSDSLRERYIKQISHIAKKRVLEMQASSLEVAGVNNSGILPTDISANMGPVVERGYTDVLSSGSDLSRESNRGPSRELDLDFDFFESKLKQKAGYVPKTEEKKINDGTVELAETLKYKPKPIIKNPLLPMFKGERELNIYLVEAKLQRQKIVILDKLLKYDPFNELGDDFAKIQIGKNYIEMKNDNSLLIEYLMVNKITNNEYEEVLESVGKPQPNLLCDLAKRDSKLFIEYCIQAKPPLKEVAKAISLLQAPNTTYNSMSADVINKIMIKTSNTDDDYLKDIKNIAIMNCNPDTFDNITDKWKISPEILKNEYLYSIDYENSNFNKNLKSLFEYVEVAEIFPSISELTKFGKNMTEETKQVFKDVSPESEPFLNSQSITNSKEEKAKILFDTNTETILKTVGPQVEKTMSLFNKLNRNPNSLDMKKLSEETDFSISEIFSRNNSLSNSDKCKASINLLLASASLDIDIKSSYENFLKQSRFSFQYIEEYNSKEGYSFFEELFSKSNNKSNQDVVSEYYDTMRMPNKVADLAMDKISSKENQVELLSAIKEITTESPSKQKANLNIIQSNNNLLQLTMNRTNRIIPANKPSEKTTSMKSQTNNIGDQIAKMFQELEIAMEKVNNMTNKIKYDTEVYVALHQSISSFTEKFEAERKMDLQASKQMVIKKEINPKLYMKPGEDLKNQGKGRER